MVIFFGPPGSGKSVQGQLLAARHGWRWLSTGQLLRETEDVDVIAAMREGRLVDDTAANRVFDDALRKAKDIDHVIVDGYPRHVAQAKRLLDILPKHERTIEAVIILAVDDNEILHRAEIRGRLDDEPEIVRRRLHEYRAQTKPVIDFFAEQGIPVARIDGMGSVGTIHDRIEEVMEQCSLV